MCRFVLYLGQPLTLASLFVEPSHSLIHQSVQSAERDEPLNGDGFGVAWYAPEISPEPATFRSITPAWNNRNLLELARVTRSGCILAHVRAATQALEVAEANCHPFTWQRFSFMHNGDLGAFGIIRRRLLASLGDRAFHAIRGSTDSEHLFALVLDRLLARAGAAPTPGDPEPLAEALVAALRIVVHMAREVDPEAQHYVNAALSDGTASVACRFTTDAPEHSDSLYLHTGRRYVCEDGLCRMVLPEAGCGAVLVASERLSDDPGWQPVPVGSLVLVHGDGRTEVRAIGAMA